MAATSVLTFVIIIYLMGENKMSVVEIIRHSYKAPDGSLSQEGRIAAVNQGAMYADKYQGRDIRVMSSSVGRAVETGDLILHGAGLYGNNVTIDERLTLSLSKDEISKVLASEQESMLEKALDGAKEGAEKDGVDLAKFADEYLKGDADVVYIGVSHAPSVQVVSYLLSRCIEDTKADAGPLEGVTIEYMEKDNVYKITLNYAGGKEIVVADADSLEEKAEETIEENAEGESDNTEGEGSETAEASE